MSDIKTNNNLTSLDSITESKLNNFSDINDEIIIKEDDNFQIFSHGNLLDLNLLRPEEKEKFSKSTELLDTGMEEKILAPLTPAIWDKKSSFYFDIQDEDDVAEELKKIKKMNEESLAGLKNKEVKKYSLTKILKKLLEDYNLNLLPELEKRLSNIVLSFLKHTRTKVDVLNLLKAPINQSGLALGTDLSNKLIDLLDSIRFKVDEVSGIVVEDQKNNEYNEKRQNQQRGENLANTDPRQEIKFENKKSTIPVINRMSVPYNKSIMTGVKQKERVVGPVDEFSEITLLAFRRLSEDPMEAAQKIMDRIRILEKESYLKKAQAIQNWRKSEVYGLYIGLGRESMEKNLPIDKIIEQKILGKEKFLTKREFSVITDLNKKLRF